MKACIGLAALTAIFLSCGAAARAETFTPLEQAPAEQGACIVAESTTADVDFQYQQVGYLADLVSGSNTCSCNSSCCSSRVCGCGGCCYDAGVYADIEFAFLRTRTPGGLRTEEEEKFSPRIIIGWEGCRGWGLRTRYWTYDHRVDIFSGTTPFQFNFDWDVWDLEGTKRVCFRNTDLVMAAGVRAGRAAIYSGGITDDCQFVGGTLAADLDTLLFCRYGGRWSLIYGGRLSFLTGDWVRSGGGGVIAPDDDWVVTEAYLGIKYSRCWRGNEIYAFAKGEYQEWDSDFLGGLGLPYKVEFVGPTVGMGIHF